MCELKNPLRQIKLTLLQFRVKQPKPSAYSTGMIMDRNAEGILEGKAFLNKGMLREVKGLEGWDTLDMVGGEIEQEGMEFRVNVA